MLGSLAPVLITGTSGEDPHHAAEKSLTPVRPRLAAVLPLSILGIEREIVGMVGDQRPHLSLRKLERLSGSGLEWGGRIESCHWFPFRPSPHIPTVICPKIAAGASHGTRQCLLGRPP